MWTFLTGYLLSVMFENQTIKLFKNNFSNEHLSIWGILIGWLFQEHVKEKCDITGGKLFMLERDFRNKFLTQIFKVLKNFIFYSYLITCLELGTFIFFLGLFFYSLSKRYLPHVKKYIKKLKSLKTKISFNTFNFNIETFINSTIGIVYRNWNTQTIFLVCVFYTLIKTGFLKIYFWFDIIFILKPLLYLMVLLYIIFCVFWLNYLLYVIMTYNISKNLALILKILTKKLVIYFSYLIFFLELIIYDLNIQNLTTENFFKEFLCKLLTFLC